MAPWPRMLFSWRLSAAPFLLTMSAATLPPTLVSLVPSPTP